MSVMAYRHPNHIVHVRFFKQSGDDIKKKIKFVTQTCTHTLFSSADGREAGEPMICALRSTVGRKKARELRKRYLFVILGN